MRGGVMLCFNTQPPEGGWFDMMQKLDSLTVSTHSRLKAAGWVLYNAQDVVYVSTHSRLKAAGSNKIFSTLLIPVSTHSRLKAAGI